MRRLRSKPKSRAPGKSCSKCKAKRNKSKMRWILSWLVWRKTTKGNSTSYRRRWAMLRRSRRRSLGLKSHPSPNLKNKKHCLIKRSTSWRKRWRTATGEKRSWILSSKTPRKTSSIKQKNRLRVWKSRLRSSSSSSKTTKSRCTSGRISILSKSAKWKTWKLRLKIRINNFWRSWSRSKIMKASLPGSTTPSRKNTRMTVNRLKIPWKVRNRLTILKSSKQKLS